MAKKVILYGSGDCPDCLLLKARFDQAGIRYGYVDILASLGHLKKFLTVRDCNPRAFASVVAAGKVGIPAVVVDDMQVFVCHGMGPEMDLSPFRP